MTQIPEPGGVVGPLGAARRYWVLCVLLVIIGGVAGVVVGRATVKTQYIGEARLVVGSDDLASYQVAGFAQAAQQLASNYARYVDNSSTVTKGLRDDLGSRESQLVSISASPIPQSDVISVEVTATSKRAAVDGADAVAARLVKLTASGQGTQAADVLKSYQAMSARAVKAQSTLQDRKDALAKAKAKKNPTSDLQDAVNKAQTTYDQLQLQQNGLGNRYQSLVNDPPSQSDLHVINPGSLISNNAHRTLEVYGVAGAVAGLVLALLLASLLQRRAARSRRARLPAATPAEDDTAPDNEWFLADR